MVNLLCEQPSVIIRNNYLCVFAILVTLLSLRSNAFAKSCAMKCVNAFERRASRVNKVTDIASTKRGSFLLITQLAAHNQSESTVASIDQKGFG